MTTIALNHNAIQILKDRYLIKDSNGHCTETPDGMFKRVAKHVAHCEEDQKQIWEQRFYNVMSNLDFLPNSPTLMNAGTPKGQLSACFVLPIKDSLKGIFTTLKNTALIHQSGGGTGFNFSNLRPKNDPITSLGGTSSGPIAFMKIYDAATEHIKQGGKRRGANMGILNVDHPDIEDFISSKTNETELQNFNISVGITDDFMIAVKKKLDWKLINPRNNKVTKTLKAHKLWELMVKEAWNTGDPGLIFLDTINTINPTPHLGRIACTNPCGEVPLLNYESCNLGSINLSHMVNENTLQIDWDKLAQTIGIAIRFLDNIISVNHYLLPKIKSVTQGNRKIGLGVMGWADMLIQLNIPFASKKAIDLGEKLMKFIKEESYKTSFGIAKEKGVFPEWGHRIYPNNAKLRNATCNSIAPTGSISVIANTSYSIEPLFALAYRRTGILGDINQLEVNRFFIQKMKSMGLWNNTLKQTVHKSGSIKHVKAIPKTIRKLFETSLDIPWQYHLLHQRAFQKYTDNAVSKTINLPENTSFKDISEIYLTAWEYGLKGITIYRYGSREKQVLQRCNFNSALSCEL